MIQGLLTSSAIGRVIAKNASLSGAEGGCQAEVGSAAAIEILRGNRVQAMYQVGIAITPTGKKLKKQIFN